MARVFVNDTTLTAIADAIREKNGSDDTYKPSQMADAVRGIQSGGSNFELANYLKNFPNAFKESVFPSDTEINLFLSQVKGVDTDSSTVSLAYMFTNSSGLKSVKIKTLDNGRAVNTFGMFQKCNNLVIADFSEFKYEILNSGNMFYECQNLETILGELKIIETNTHIFSNVKKLKEVRLARGMLRKSILFAGASLLSDESIQSIIDGLATVEESQTLTFHKDVKAKLTEAQISQITSKNWTLA